MTQMLEGVLVDAFNELVADDSEKCDAHLADTNWKANINKHGGNCTGTNLYEKLSKQAAMGKSADFGYLSKSPHPYVEKAVVGKLADCGPTRFPIQAHHLIPKNFLPDQEVCRFLSAKAKAAGKGSVKVKADTDYDNDAAANGYCLPYATPLAEWKAARGQSNADEQKDDVTSALMTKTRRQLHQGSHQEARYDDPEDAEVDESEADDSGADHDAPGGYLETVGLLLDLVAMYADAHAFGCSECSQHKDEIPPRARVAQHVHQVSGITKLLMDGRRIFVSERAHGHFGISRKRASKKDAPGWLR